MGSTFPFLGSGAQASVPRYYQQTIAGDKWKDLGKRIMPVTAEKHFFPWSPERHHLPRVRRFRGSARTLPRSLVWLIIQRLIDTDHGDADFTYMEYTSVPADLVIGGHQCQRYRHQLQWFKLLGPGLNVILRSNIISPSVCLGGVGQIFCFIPYSGLHRAELTG